MEKGDKGGKTQKDEGKSEEWRTDWTWDQTKLRCVNTESVPETHKIKVKFEAITYLSKYPLKLWKMIMSKTSQ